MTKKLEELASPLIEQFKLLGTDITELIIKVQIEFLNGHEVLDEKIISMLKSTNLQCHEIENIQCNRLIEINNNNIVGIAGMSLTPTPHTYLVNNQKVFVWCAADAIIFPLFHNHAANIVSHDPINGREIKLVVTPNGIKNLEPDCAVVSWVHMKHMPNPDKVQSDWCNQVHFFYDSTSAIQGTNKNSGLVILTIEEVFKIGLIIKESEPIKSVLLKIRKTAANKT
ncbi:hypothetical protein JYT51_02055 [Candidatus Amoebophilus asiaticus]|nr:hypothetical protein [Candidatus Amoebophilus asiaticus]